MADKSEENHTPGSCSESAFEAGRNNQISQRSAFLTANNTRNENALPWPPPEDDNRPALGHRTT